MIDFLVDVWEQEGLYDWGSVSYQDPAVFVTIKSCTCIVGGQSRIKTIKQIFLNLLYYTLMTIVFFSFFLFLLYMIYFTWPSTIFKLNTDANMSMINTELDALFSFRFPSRWADVIFFFLFFFRCFFSKFGVYMYC
jgi:hypothetical protein